MSESDRTPDVSVCIVSFNTQEHLRECLSSIFCATDGLGVEVIVVDNASVDGSAAMVRAQFPTVRLIQNERNLYFTRANNLALRVARGHYVLILNSDTLLRDDTLTGMVSFMNAHPLVGAATCRQFDLTCRPLQPFWRFRKVADLVKFLYLWMFLARLKPANDGGDDGVARLDQDQCVQVITDACMIMRQAARQEIGLYDERFLLYYTEDDFCQRLNQAGWQVYYIAGVQILHKGAQSTRKLPKFSHRRICTRDMMRYAHKYLSPLNSVTVTGLAYLDLAAVGVALAGRYIWNLLPARRG